MLKDRYSTDDLLELTPATVPGFAETAVNAEVLNDDLASGTPFSRKRLCEYLGVAESTLSGWLKEDRIPRAIKEAYFLLLAVQALQGEIKALRNQASDLKILEDGGCYKICLFDQNEDGEVIGRVVADAIGTIDIARELVAARRIRNLLRKAQDAVSERQESCETGGSHRAAEYYESIYHEIDSALAYVENFAEWRNKFGLNPPLPEI